MKVKYAFVAMTVLFLLVSVSQMLPVPPYADDMESVYKSGYFRELERECSIIKDSFVGIKTMATPAFAWIYLEDLGPAHDISVKVYNRRGHSVTAPGMSGESPDASVAKVLSEVEPKLASSIRNGKYFTIMPVRAEDRCSFCHENVKVGGIIGYMSFERSYDAQVYYSRERIIIFLAISVVLMVILFLFLRWDPHRNIKEMFDKS